MSVIVLGGGVTGLSCAYYLKKFGKDLIKKVILIEGSSSLGGSVKSSRFPDGTVYEHGPRGIRVGDKSGYNTLHLVEELGLAPEMLTVSVFEASARRRMIWAKNKLHVLPFNIKAIFRKQEPFSKPLALFAFKELLTKAKKDHDESIHDFACRRFGNEIAEFVMDPVCRGVIAGNYREISVRSLLPNIYRAEQEHGSVIKGQIKTANKSKLASFLDSKLAVSSKQELWSQWSLKTGLQRLPEKLTSSLTDDQDGLVQLFTNTTCKKVHFEDGKPLVRTEEGVVLKCDHIFSCLPARNLSRVLSEDQPALAQLLSNISTVHVAVVNLEYNGKVLQEKGFGYLIPSTEDTKVLGAVFDSCCFPAHDGQYADKTRITVMMGGYWFDSHFANVSDPRVFLDAAVDAVGRHLNINIEPTRHNVTVQKNCIPQYRVGHYAILEGLNKEVLQNKLALSLLGASYQGVSINDCIYNARLDVERYLQTLQS